jgi:hypothetical protein
MVARARPKTRRQTVPAPVPEGDLLALPAVINVRLGEDEQVRWIWTHANGESIVTGYDIVDKNAGRETLEV